MPTPIATPDFSALEEQQRARLGHIKRGRNAESVAAVLTELGRVARGSEPLMPPIISAVRARATLGEISDTLRQVWGVYRPS
jgi:methylmalonyl-CoA mutase, N-terminal domain